MSEGERSKYLLKKIEEIKDDVMSVKAIIKKFENMGIINKFEEKEENEREENKKEENEREENKKEETLNALLNLTESEMYKITSIYRIMKLEHRRKQNRIKSKRCYIKKKKGTPLGEKFPVEDLKNQAS